MEFVTELELVGGIILTGAITIAFTTKNCSSDYIISFVLSRLDEYEGVAKEAGAIERVERDFS